MKKNIVLIVVMLMILLVGCTVKEPVTSGTVQISLSETSDVSDDLEIVIVDSAGVEKSIYLEAAAGYEKTFEMAFGEYRIDAIRNINDKTISYEIAKVVFNVSEAYPNQEVILNISKDVLLDEKAEIVDSESEEVEKVTEDTESTEDVITPDRPEESVEIPVISEPETDNYINTESEEVTLTPEIDTVPAIPVEPEILAQIFTGDSRDVWVTSAVNIRKEPNLEAEILGVFSVGQKLTRIGVSNDGWSKIIWNDEHVYCSSRYLTVEEPVQEDIYPMVYEDETAKITITKEWYENAWAYIAHLEFTDYSRLGTAVSNGKYQNGYETTSNAAKRLGAIFAVNGCYSAPKLNYVVVRDGIIWNRPESTLNLPAIYSKHNGLFSNAWDNSRPEELKGNKTIQELVDAGLMTDSFCFGPPILINGEILAENNYDRAQRTFIGTNGNPGDLWIVVSDGRKNDGESSGLNYYQCGKLLLDKGCTFGICLDGGGSSTMVFQGDVLNANGANERAVVDFVYFK